MPRSIQVGLPCAPRTPQHLTLPLTSEIIQKHRSSRKQATTRMRSSFRLSIKLHQRSGGLVNDQILFSPMAGGMFPVSLPRIHDFGHTMILYGGRIPPDSSTLPPKVWSRKGWQSRSIVILRGPASYPLEASCGRYCFHVVRVDMGSPSRTERTPRHVFELRTVDSGCVRRGSSHSACVKCPPDGLP